jgi:hypothetical protein
MSEKKSVLLNRARKVAAEEFKARTGYNITVPDQYTKVELVELIKFLKTDSKEDIEKWAKSMDQDSGSRRSRKNRVKKSRKSRVRKSRVRKSRVRKSRSRKSRVHRIDNGEDEGIEMTDLNINLSINYKLKKLLNTYQEIKDKDDKKNKEFTKRIRARIERLEMALRSESLESKERNLKDADDELFRLSKLYLSFKSKKRRNGCGCSK